MREIALDTETTGLDPHSGHRIVEIGCVEMINRIRTGNTFHAYLNPDRDMPDEAFRIHGLSVEFLSDKPRFHDVVEELVVFLSDSPLVIHNAQFDMKFINYELSKVGKQIIALERAIDTVSMARKKYPGSPVSLDALCKRFMVDASARTKHGALLDAELLCEVYLELTGGRQSSLELAAQSAPVLQQQYAAVHMEIPRREFLPSDEEKSRHDALLAKLKNPLWHLMETAKAAKSS